MRRMTLPLIALLLTSAGQWASGEERPNFVLFISANLAWFPAMLKDAGYYTVLSGKGAATRSGQSVPGRRDEPTPGEIACGRVSDE